MSIRTESLKMVKNRVLRSSEESCAVADHMAAIDGNGPLVSPRGLIGVAFLATAHLAAQPFLADLPASRRAIPRRSQAI
jgi:hypothetical protein